MKFVKNKRIRNWFIALLSLFIVIDFGATLYFYRVACVRNDSPVSQVSTSSPNYDLVSRFNHLPKSTETITNDGLKLDAWYVPAATPTNKTVIVVHGFRQDKSAMRQYGQLFHELGYNVLMPDNRGAGQSAGQFISFGYHDKSDVIAWAKFITVQAPQSQITLYGLSMGASTVMMASGQSTLPQTVKNIIEDCGYSDAWSEITYQAKAQYNLPAFPLVYSVSLESKLRQDWFFQEASATKALAKDKLPILFIHGDKDTYVPTSMLYDNYKATPAGVPKELLLVKGASHAKAFETEPKLYRATVAKFMAKYNPILH